MHTAEAAAAPAAAPTAAPAAPGTFSQFFSKCSDPSSSDPSCLFQMVAAEEEVANEPDVAESTAEPQRKRQRVGSGQKVR